MSKTKKKSINKPRRQPKRRKATKAASSPSPAAATLEEVPQKRQMKFQRPRGMRDILPEDWHYFDYIYRTAESILRSYDFARMETPVIEDIGLFAKAIGESTDIVSKEMFVIKERGEGKLALRPEFTAGLVRAYIENGMTSRPQPVKLYSQGPLFRAERPQAGRYRQFHQINWEIYGGEKSALDAQIIQIAWRLFQRLGISDIVIQLNSIGCRDCRPVYRQQLLDYYRPYANKLCADCKKRLKSNPLRVLDCKEEKCQRVAANAPQMFDNLCDNCHDHFKQLLEILDELDIPYMLNAKIVRGLDYYSRTVFEVWPADEGKSELAQSAFGGGGRYDGLFEVLGGQPTPAVGIALGVERIMLEMKEREIEPPARPVPAIFLAQLGEKAKKQCFKIFEELYLADIDVIESLGRDSLKSQLKQAEKKNVVFTLILGQKEAVDGTMIVRDMESGVQEVVSQDGLIKYLRERLKVKAKENHTKIIPNDEKKPEPPPKKKKK
ncbi:histidine--tRNA ligase [Patescibacteria group bacterium]